MGVGVLIVLAAVGEGILLSASHGSTYIARGVKALPSDAIVAHVYSGTAPERRASLTALTDVPGVRSVAVGRRSPDGSMCQRACFALIRSDGRAETVERVRNALPFESDVKTAAEMKHQTSDGETGRWSQLLQLAMLLVLAVTAASLLVSTVDGMMERRRPLAVLSAIGVPIATLRRSVLAQVALPLVAALGLGIATGLIVANLLFQFAEQPLTLPAGLLLVTSAAAAGVVLVVTLSSFPWLRIARRPELLRTE
jgi:predicted lysophospholipase L1 biosynthesis ABC-type transport system permease subunit